VRRTGVTSTHSEAVQKDFLQQYRKEVSGDSGERRWLAADRDDSYAQPRDSPQREHHRAFYESSGSESLRSRMRSLVIASRSGAVDNVSYFEKRSARGIRKSLANSVRQTIVLCRLSSSDRPLRTDHEKRCLSTTTICLQRKLIHCAHRTG